MQKVLLTFLSLFLVIINSSAQDELEEFTGEIRWSQLFEVSKRVSAPDILGHDGEYAYLMRYVKRKRVLEKYSLRNLTLEKSVEIELEYKGQDLMLKNQFMYGNTPVLYTSFFNKKLNTNYSFVQTINPNTLVVSAPIPVSETKVPKSKGLLGNLSNSSGVGSYLSGSFLISDDRELGFIAESVYADQEKKGDEFKTMSTIGRLFDSKMNLLIENSYELPYESFSVAKTKVGNNGLIYMAGFQTGTEVDESRLIKRTSTTYGDLEILVLDLESGDIEILVVDIADRKVRGFTFDINEKDEIIVAGFIGKETGGISGTFYSRYDSNLKEKGASFEDFEEDFITQDWSDRTKEKMDKKNKKKAKKGEKKTEPAFYQYIVRDLIQKPDGTTCLLAEQYYMRVVTRTYTDSQGNTRTTTTYYYYYKDVIALNFDADGELLWKSIIDKYQVSTNDGGYYSSFFTVVDGNDISIVYNDRESNSVDTDGMTKQQKKALKKKTVGVRVLIDSEGNTSKEKLFEFEEGGLRLVPKLCEDADEEMVFMYARGRRGDKLGVIEF